MGWEGRRLPSCRQARIRLRRVERLLRRIDRHAPLQRALAQLPVDIQLDPQHPRLSGGFRVERALANSNSRPSP